MLTDMDNTSEGRRKLADVAYQEVPTLECQAAEASEQMRRDLDAIGSGERFVTPRLSDEYPLQP